MNAHHLDFTHAFTHRLSDVSPAASRFAAGCGPCAERLTGELAAGTLPFLSLPFRARLEAALPPLLKGLTARKHMLVLGIGGSALGARALQKAFAPGQDRPAHTGPCIWIADNIDAGSLEAWMASLNPRETVVVVISKSGGTIETMAQYFIIRAWLQAALHERWREHCIFITDENKGHLRLEADAHNIPTLPVPDHLGGRYSIFSAVGLLPAGFLGIDYHALLAGAAAIADPLLKEPRSLGSHPSWRLALWNRELMEQGYSELIFFSYIPAWQYVGAWFSQLWAESLGKDGKGSMPVPALGVTDQHSINQMFLDGPRNKGCIFLSSPTLPPGPAFRGDIPAEWAYLKNKRFGDLLQAESLSTRMALTASGVPLVHAELGATDEYALGRFMQLAMLTTILTGWLLGINPIDQPAVELGKRLANARLGAPGYEKEDGDLAGFLAREGDTAARVLF